MQRRTRERSSKKGETTPAPAKRSRLRRRVIVLFCSLAAALTVISGRLFSLQVYQYADLVEAAKRQSSDRISSVSRRGTIYDRNGRDLAISLGTSSIAARPSQIVDPKRAAAALSVALSLPAEKILERLQAGKPFVWIKRSVSTEEAQAVARLML
ncbi:MAG TPA: hypothetical protein VN444_06580, partial [Verrucomicrobiae bacterium]|nr:hypothetical protein [Verrucomicrobiae bacterium]